MFCGLEILKKWRIHIIFGISNAVQEKLRAFKFFKNAFLQKVVI